MAACHKGMKFTKWVDKLPTLRALIAAKWTYGRIALHFGVSRKAVSQACRQYGIKSLVPRGRPCK